VPAWAGRLAHLLRVASSYRQFMRAVRARRSVNREAPDGTWVAVALVMTIEPEITFRNMKHSQELAGLVREKVGKLETIHGEIERCTVLIEQPHRHHQTGKHFHVRLVVAVPGSEIVVAHEPEGDGSYEDAHFAVNHAFAALRRRMDEHLRRIREAHR
jgi:ribosome-associated translation inhibitor RaiA